MEIRPKCYVATTNTASGIPESYLAKSLRYSQDSHEIPKDEPQADGILFKGDLKEGEYKLIKTTDGWVLANEDIVYCGWERGNE